jgi:hypothetical protein
LGRCQKTQRNSKPQANAHSNETNQQRVLTAHQQQGRNVAPKAVSAKPMLGTGSCQFVGNVYVSHWVGRPKQRQGCAEDQQSDNDSARGKTAVLESLLHTA